MSENIKICQNCDAEIPENKFFLHEPYCIKNVKKCAICKEVIQIEDEEDHNKEFHTNIPCKFCKKGFPKQQVLEHISKCDEQPSECQYCRLTVIYKDKRDHEYVCGSKTEYCSDCKKYIAMKDFENHKNNNCYLELPKSIEKVDSSIPKKNNNKNPKLELNYEKDNSNKKEKEIQDIHKELKEKIERLENKDKIEKSAKINTNSKSPIDVHKELKERTDLLDKKDKIVKNVITNITNKNSIKNTNEKGQGNNSNLNIVKEKNKLIEIENKNTNYKDMMKENLFAERPNFKAHNNNYNNNPTNNMNKNLLFKEISSNNVNNYKNQMNTQINKPQINSEISKNKNLNSIISKKEQISGNVINAGKVKVTPSNVLFTSNQPKVESLNTKMNSINNKVKSSNDIRNNISQNHTSSKQHTKNTELAQHHKDNAHKNYDHINILSDKNYLIGNKNEKNDKINKENKSNSSNHRHNEKKYTKENIIPKVNDNKQMYDPTKFMDDYIPDEYIVQDTENFEHYNYDIGDKKSNIEDEVLKKVIAMSRGNQY